MKTIINTPKAPAAIGPYSQAVEFGDFIFTSGQIALDPATGKLIEGSFENRVRQVMKNLVAVLAAGDCDFSNVLKTTIYVTDLANFSVLNQIYGEYLGAAEPARATIQVAALPLGTDIEIDMIAHR